MTARPIWTPEDDQLVRSYQSGGPGRRGECIFVAELLGRDPAAVRNRRSLLRRLERQGKAPRYLSPGRPRKTTSENS